MDAKTGVLLINLGTPDSPRRPDVSRYLKQFLLDPRVLDIPAWKRQILVRGIIAPFRSRSSGRTYQQIWTEEGSPLLVYSRQMQELLQAELGDSYLVTLGMRYQSPAIEAALSTLRKAQVKRIIAVPLFPQYASASTGSAHQEVMEVVSKWPVVPDISFINSYPTQPEMIQAFAERAQQVNINDFDHTLFSFHGLPERQIRSCDDSNTCLTNADCCETKTLNNQFCYRAQCVATAAAIAEELAIHRKKYSVCFQSRLGSDPWIQPFTPDVIQDLAQQGAKRLLVFSPSFVCDCLETTYEIGVEYQEEFEAAGGEKVQLVEGLNAHPLWIQALKKLVLDRMPQGEGREPIENYAEIN